MIVKENNMKKNSKQVDSRARAQFHQNVADRKATFEAKANTLAKVFCKQLLFDMGRFNLEKAAELNKAEGNPQVCHTHDFCDANMSMHAAGKCLGYWGEDYSISRVYRLWNAAWDIAKAADFRMGA